MRQYSIDQVEATWAGLDLKTGIAEGTSIVPARNAPTYTQKPTGNGRLIRVRNPDRSGTITITVDQTSKLHQELLAVALADRALGNVVKTLQVTDNTTGATHTYINAFITTDPDQAFGTEAATYPWVFGFESMEGVPQVGDAKLVGS